MQQLAIFLLVQYFILGAVLFVFNRVRVIPSFIGISAAFPNGFTLVANVIYTNRSSLFGERLFVNDVQGSMVDAYMMRLDMVKHSNLW